MVVPRLYLELELWLWLWLVRGLVPRGRRIVAERRRRVLLRRGAVVTFQRMDDAAREESRMALHAVDVLLL